MAALLVGGAAIGVVQSRLQVWAQTKCGGCGEKIQGGWICCSRATPSAQSQELLQDWQFQKADTCLPGWAKYLCPNRM